MEEFPAQSHKSREPRQVQPVTTSVARVRKAPLGQRLRETFIQGDARTVWASMIWETFFPNLRDNFADAVHNGIDSLFDGTTTSYRRNRNTRYARTNSNISRHNPDRVLGRNSPTSETRYSDDARRNHDFSVLEIDSRVEAEEVLSQMNLLIDQFDICTLADFYQMVRITPTHADYKFGWEELGGARVVHSRGSYYLDLPAPIQIK